MCAGSKAPRYAANKRRLLSGAMKVNLSNKKQNKFSSHLVVETTVATKHRLPDVNDVRNGIDHFS